MLRQYPLRLIRLALAATLAAWLPGAVLHTRVMGASTASFTNPATIEITESGLEQPYQATPYPSTIQVAGLTGTVTKVVVTLHNFSHEAAGDVDILLAGPTGQKSILMSDAGGTFGVSDLALTFDATAPALPQQGPLSSGTFAPRDYSTFSPDEFPAPAPAGPYTASLALFDGTNPNGAWSLYVVDDLIFDEGEIAGGWTLTLTTETPPPPRLEIARAGANATLHWPAAATGYVLEARAALGGVPMWNAVMNPVVTLSGTNFVTVPATNGNSFFRLRQ